MAGNQNSGRKPNFPMTEKQLEQAISDYKDNIKNSDYRPSWPHFAASIGMTEAEIKEFVETFGEDPKNANYGRARALRVMMTWIRGETLSGPRWSGQMAGLAKSSLDVDFGDGFTYAKAGASKGAGNTVIMFGDGDDRAKDAGK